MLMFILGFLGGLGFCIGLRMAMVWYDERDNGWDNDSRR